MVSDDRKEDARPNLIVIKCAVQGFLEKGGGPLICKSARSAFLALLVFCRYSVASFGGLALVFYPALCLR